MKKALLVALVLIFVYFQGRLWFGYNSLTEIRQLQAEVQSLQSEIRIQRQINARLRAQVEALRDTDNPDAMEEQIRERLGLTHEDETLFLFIQE
ncbi:septum formation initiator family protein [Natronospirillum operosum]|uniref:Septum formation initiator family protein n=1 Tax=Natronospirillum operosum TaxID=2759953 RepID=A0A4Z0WDR2_9GAMM|nr:septum formation initiator family protein [Natronospirillum operosum]TGG95140.1 septum formation initiator family protein [Natronospirillum operosum]